MSILLTAVISSSVVAALISALTTYSLKGLDFKNEYYKKIIEKRFDAYAKVERIITLLQRISIDVNDNSKYHWAFEDWHVLGELKDALNSALFQGMWISTKALDLVLDLDKIFNRLDKEFPFDRHNDSVMAGKHYFDELEILKMELEYRCKIDLLNLHKLKILKPKKN